MKIGIVTPTVSPERKPFLDFLKKRMEKQTRVPDMWYLVNYANKTGKIDLTERYEKGITLAFKEQCDLVLFMEDDDYYPLTYIEDISNEWQKTKCNLIGVDPTVYYHLGLKAIWTSKSIKHASAFCTGVARNAKINVCPDNFAFFDLALWKANENKMLCKLETPPIGIKHGLGVCGGSFHRTQARYDKYDDKQQSILRSLVDEEAFEFYKSIKL